MTPAVFWGLLGAGVALVLWGLARRTGAYVPLARRQPKINRPSKPELGLEAVDHDALAQVMRTNAALDRGVSWLGNGYTQADLVVPPEADDADYARRFHRAYNRKT